MIPNALRIRTFTLIGGVSVPIEAEEGRKGTVTISRGCTAAKLSRITFGTRRCFRWN
jgi:hypothetical protein